MRGSLGKLYHDGEVIVRQGDTGDCMYVVQEGKVEVVRSANGPEVVVAVLPAGECFGEMAIFERETRSATVRARGEARVLTVDKKTLLRRFQEDPTLALNLLRSLSQRIRRMDRELSAARRQLEVEGRDG
jgi:CRP-like cAMP-binding protein